MHHRPGNDLNCYYSPRTCQTGSVELKRFTSAQHAIHRFALLPVLAGALPESGIAGTNKNAREFADFLYCQRLHTCWLDLAVDVEREARFSELMPYLREYARISAARELPQQRVLSEIIELFSNHEIPWFVAKGCHLRQVLYAQPNLRPAVDIDVFVHESDKRRAIEVLTGHDYVAKPLPETLSHEIKLNRLGADVDLHWDLFRPGRARKGLMAWLFEHRCSVSGLQGLDDTASLLVMLVHPAITKYLLSPASMLIHLVDQSRLIAREAVDWEQLESTLDRFGLRTAAWSSLYLLRKLGEVEAPDGFEDKIKPGNLQAWYLQNWIDRGWIEKWFDRRWVTAGLFSLALQDSISDAGRSLQMLRKARNNPERDLLEFNQ